MQSISHDKDDAPGATRAPNATATQATPDFASRAAARVALAVALLLGVAADRLLSNGPTGLGWVLWIALLGTGAVVIVRQARFPWQRETTLAGAVAVCAAVIPAMRASDELHGLAMLVLITAASLPLLRARRLRFGATPVVAQLLGLATVGGNALVGVVPLMASDIGRSGVPTRMLRVPLVAARAALLAVPPLVVFGALFASADPLFERYLREVVRFGTQDVFAHLAFALTFCWISAGLLRGLLPRRSPLSNLPVLPSVPTVELNVALGAVTGLFLVFVIVQARWLFGGAEVLQASTGLTVAQYARRGFFQLVAAAALVLPLLLAADAASRDASPAAHRIARILSASLLALVFVVMASAMQRMTLYTQRFGLTDQRLYATAFMGWLAVVFAWYVITTLRGRPLRFSAGPIVAGIIAVFTLAAANPDALIARVNLARAHEGAPVDGNYLAQLSVDAAPVLLAHFAELPPQARCRVARKLLHHYNSKTLDWRFANRSHVEAVALTGDNLDMLRGATTCQ